MHGTVIAYMLIGTGISLFVIHFVIFHTTKGWAKRWQHKDCGWIGDNKPDVCPKCGVEGPALSKITARPKYLGGWEVKTHA